MKSSIFLVFLVSNTCFAAIHQVGSTRTYISPNALYQADVISDGDTIEIDADLYSGATSLAVWQNDDLLIRGVGGRPHLEADGEYIWGKGIWVLAGTNITVENIEFSGAAVPDLNGAGIRLDGIGLTVRHCYFHDNENGILTSNPYDGDILIEYSEFDHNGAGDGFSHNLYIGHVNKLTFRFNYSHHTFIGHNLKSRANENYILYNRIMDEEDGQSSRLIDLSNGGFSIVMGNLLMQGNDAENNNLVGYGREGLTNSASEFYFINNTSVNKRTASCIFLDIESGTSIANITNNIFAGTGTVMNGAPTSMSNNITDDDIDNIFFVDEPNYDYAITSFSPAVNAGTVVSPINGNTLTPEFSYVHPTYAKERINVLEIDVGAIEGDVLHAASDQARVGEMLVYPNPFVDRVMIKNNEIDNSQIFLLSISGENLNSMTSVFRANGEVVLDLSNLLPGVYILKTQFHEHIIRKVHR